MAVSKRTRYEVLRRDNHTCRYCGATAPDAVLTVDHVLPVSLGGTDKPDNLVAACKDCNAGKAASNPDAPLLENVHDDALRWAKAMQQAAEIAEREHHKEMAYVGAFVETWEKVCKHLPYCNFEASLKAIYRAGFPESLMVDAVFTAFMASNVRDEFTYFCGVCWHQIRDMQQVAQGLIETEKDVD